MEEKFSLFARKVTVIVGSPFALIIAIAVVVVWGISGQIFHFSDTWQLVINTGTTIITFVMVFLIQNTQNIDNKAIQLKLDELLRAQNAARNRLVDLEDCTPEELRELEKQFKRIRTQGEDSTDISE